ncbi:MAG: tripartite tricarboxylate transporter substrate binding protein [Burkholderiales bacterium]|nr:tripartite tricarboxylate transporter substrate binding protein [Burkholderiales bacterium]
MHRIATLLLSTALCALVPGLVQAQSSFKAPIKIIVPYAAGGGSDSTARIVAPGLSKELGQPVVIENRPGASGQIGTQLVQNAAPDGQTILLGVDHSLIIVPLTQPNVKYDASDFVPLGQAIRTFWTLLIPPNAPYKDFKEYVAAVKRDPLLRSYGVGLAGGAPAAVGNAIGKYAGVAMTEVPYQGSAPVLQNVMGGQVPAGVTGMPEAATSHRSGKAKVIAVSGATRTPLLPDVPTFKELGVDGLEFYTFVGFFAPKGFSPAMAREFNAALRKTLLDPAVQEKIVALGLQPTPESLEDAQKEVGDIARFWKSTVSPVAK